LERARSPFDSLSGQGWSPGRGWEGEWDLGRGMPSRIDAWRGPGRFVRRGRLCIRGVRRMAVWMIEVCRMGWSGDRPFRDRNLGVLVSDEVRCNMVDLSRFHREGEEEEANWD
jgi:hypothetical protein